MQRLRLTLAAVFVAATAIPATAAGLLDKLPADGSKVVYDMTLSSKRGDREMKISGTLAVSSVGRSKVDDKNCRWIEIVMTMSFRGMERTTIAKILVPEDELGAGKNPIANIKKGWLKRGDGEATAIKPDDKKSLGPLPVFFPGPLSDVKKLGSAKIKTGLGTLDCQGISGTRNIKQGTTELHVQYETRMTDKSPYGIASGNFKVKETRNGMERPSTTMEFTLKEIGKNAKSTLPDKR